VNVTVTERSIVIRWPAPRDGGLIGWATLILDAETGKPITTCMRGQLRFAADDLINADLTLYCTAAGEPILDSAPEFDEGGEALTGVFRFRVARMEVQEAARPAAVAG
jgi:hypothetical protein